VLELALQGMTMGGVAPQEGGCGTAGGQALPWASLSSVAKAVAKRKKITTEEDVRMVGFYLDVAAAGVGVLVAAKIYYFFCPQRAHVYAEPKAGRVQGGCYD
jgi:hypothetical protein